MEILTPFRFVHHTQTNRLDTIPHGLSHINHTECIHFSPSRSESPELKMDLLYLILDSVKALNVTAQKAVIRSVVNCLLDDGAGLLAKDKTRCLFVLLQNPLFVSQSTYTILAHLLQQVRPSDFMNNQI